MTRRVPQEALIARKEIVAGPVGRACEDHNFGLPPAIHLLTAALFMGFISVLCLTLATPGLRRPDESHTTSVGSRNESDEPGARTEPRQVRSYTQ